jgi:hypothetical protein
LATIAAYMTITYTLKPHADNPAANFLVTAAVDRKSQMNWRVVYEIAGAIDQISLPMHFSKGVGVRLWEETCFEFFIRRLDGQYIELNFSPSGQWSCFSFKDYRVGMDDLRLAGEPKMSTRSSMGKLALEVSVDLAKVKVFDRSDLQLQVSPTVVIKMKDQRYCYFAIDFPDGAADFHHSDGFRLFEMRCE